MTLTEANGRVHALLEELFFQCIDALTALNVAGAQAAWEELRARILAHRDLEDRASLDHYRTLGDFARGAKPENFDYEHDLLHRHLDEGRELLQALPDDALRRQATLQLERLFQVRRVLEHHTVREQSHLYPRLDEALSEDQRDALLAALEAQAV